MKIQTIHKLKMPFDRKIRGLNWICNRITTNLENYLIKKKSITNNIQDNDMSPKVILSMTTFPAREKVVMHTIKSLLNQSVPANKFIIWLAREQYSSEIIPDVFTSFFKYGVEVKFCEDLKSHKKYYYTMLQNPNDLIITVDDDVIYPEDTIEKLLNCHRKFPEAVICNQARLIKIDKGNFLPYKDWKTYIPNVINKPSHLILPIGCGGVLYPPNSLPDITFEKSLFQSLAPYEDDLWLKFMEMYNGTRVMITSSHQRGLSDVKTKDDIKRLSQKNISGGMNDQTIFKLCNYFPNLIRLILEDYKDIYIE